jgi:hypothetical protein
MESCGQGFRNGNLRLKVPASAIGQTSSEYGDILKCVAPRGEATMEIAPGAPVLPEDVALMRSALDEVVNILPAFQRTSAMRTKLASRILAAVAKGERDPIQLRISALLAPADE